MGMNRSVRIVVESSKNEHYFKHYSGVKRCICIVNSGLCLQELMELIND